MITQVFPNNCKDAEETYCDMQERNYHKAFSTLKDFARQCRNCQAIRCRYCHTGIDPHSSDSDSNQKAN